MIHKRNLGFFTTIDTETLFQMKDSEVDQYFKLCLHTAQKRAYRWEHSVECRCNACGIVGSCTSTVGRGRNPFRAVDVDDLAQELFLWILEREKVGKADEISLDKEVSPYFRYNLRRQADRLIQDERKRQRPLIHANVREPWQVSRYEFDGVEDVEIRPTWRFVGFDDAPIDRGNDDDPDSDAGSNMDELLFEADQFEAIDKQPFRVKQWWDDEGFRDDLAAIRDSNPDLYQRSIKKLHRSTRAGTDDVAIPDSACHHPACAGVATCRYEISDSLINQPLPGCHGCKIKHHGHTTSSADLKGDIIYPPVRYSFPVEKKQKEEMKSEDSDARP